MRALATWSGAVAGLLLILVGGLIPAYTPFAADGALLIRPLGITLQVPAMLLTALVCGPRSALLATVAYLSVGLFQMPIFTDGGGFAYLQDPGFGYLAGFVPAAWLSGRLARQNGMNDPLALLGAGLLGLLVMHACGLLNLLSGALVGRWDTPLLVLLVSYSAALVPQAIAACAVALLALLLRRLLLVES
ncbi:MAG: biotin transporter BioY [Cyanobacteriota bacterium]|nr:biotin transporter BioY [Cyanobacteriota bacterium]